MSRSRQYRSSPEDHMQAIFTARLAIRASFLSLFEQVDELLSTCGPGLSVAARNEIRRVCAAATEILKADAAADKKAVAVMNGEDVDDDVDVDDIYDDDDDANAETRPTAGP
jgi:hypothetical protein